VWLFMLVCVAFDVALRNLFGIYSAVSGVSLNTSVNLCGGKTGLKIRRFFWLR
jgi:hypothetical protein